MCPALFLVALGQGAARTAKGCRVQCDITPICFKVYQSCLHRLALTLSPAQWTHWRDLGSILPSPGQLDENHQRRSTDELPLRNESLAMAFCLCQVSRLGGTLCVSSGTPDAPKAAQMTAQQPLALLADPTDSCHAIGKSTLASSIGFAPSRFKPSAHGSPDERTRTGRSTPGFTIDI